jgi:hypothetical protein
MRRFFGVVGLGALALFSMNCTAPVGSGLAVPPDAADTCANHCREIGMHLTAVAIMASNVGCICQHGGSKAEAPGGEASSAGMATIMLEEEARRAREQQAATQKQ